LPDPREQVDDFDYAPIEYAGMKPADRVAIKMKREFPG